MNNHPTPSRIALCATRHSRCEASAFSRDGGRRPPMPPPPGEGEQNFRVRNQKMTAALRFDPIRLPPECERLRKEVRAFLAEEIAAGTFNPHKPNREHADAPQFSRRVGAKGWLRMTWPKQHDSHERPFLHPHLATQQKRV